MQALEEFGQNSGNKEIPVDLEGRNILLGYFEWIGRATFTGWYTGAPTSLSDDTQMV